MAALLPDLDVRSVLNVVEENFEKIGLKSCAYRIIYAGEHCLSKEEVITVFEETVHDVNSMYCDINICGFLLAYDSYFVHVLEGSEDTIHRQLRFLFKREQTYIEEIKQKEEPTEGLAGVDEEVQQPEIKMFKRMKLLMIYNSITTRLFDNWRARTAKPPMLVTKLDIYLPMLQHMEQLKICLDKINKLCDMMRSASDINFDGVSATDPKVATLPEVGLLDFLLSSQYVTDMRQCYHMHRRVDDYFFYFEEVWPLPTHFTPRLLYKLKIDDSFVEPLPVMPWEMVKKEKTDEEEKEERSSQSSSD